MPTNTDIVEQATGEGGGLQQPREDLQHSGDLPQQDQQQPLSQSPSALSQEGMVTEQLRVENSNIVVPNSTVIRHQQPEPSFWTVQWLWLLPWLVGLLIWYLWSKRKQKQQPAAAEINVDAAVASTAVLDEIKRAKAAKKFKKKTKARKLRG